MNDELTIFDIFNNINTYYIIIIIFINIIIIFIIY